MKFEKFLGCLVGAAAGDALGAPTETRTREQIEKRFGGYVNTFLEPPNDVFARGNKPGQVTDDFGLAYEACCEIIKNGGEISESVIISSLLNWAKDEKHFEQFVGPTSRSSIYKLRGEPFKEKYNFPLINDNEKATNGSAMKISPIALFSNGNVKKAINDSIIVSSPSHDNNISMSATAAVAAATAIALNENSSIYEILLSAIKVAEEVDDYAKIHYQTLAGPSVSKKIKLAIEIAQKSDTFDEVLTNISDIIGTGAAAYESVPAAFGIIAAANGDTLKAIFGAVNIGCDTDSIATIVGGIMGAMNGINSFPNDYLRIIDESNGYNLSKLAKDIIDLTNK